MFQCIRPYFRTTETRPNPNPNTNPNLNPNSSNLLNFTDPTNPTKPYHMMVYGIHGKWKTVLHH